MGRLNSKFIGNLDARHLEGKWWMLLEPFAYYSAKFDITICAPAGFVTDFSSVPRWPIIYWFAGGTGNQESVPHDVGYRWFNERWMFDYMFFEGGQVRSTLRTNQNNLYKIGRFIRTTGMSCGVVIGGFTSLSNLPGCLDYRHKDICKKENRICEECDNYYPAWIFCKMTGYQPDILKLHGA
jgi:hypothetical protein